MRPSNHFLAPFDSSSRNNGTAGSAFDGLYETPYENFDLYEAGSLLSTPPTAPVHSRQSAPLFSHEREFYGFGLPSTMGGHAERERGANGSYNRDREMGNPLSMRDNMGRAGMPTSYYSNYPPNEYRGYNTGASSFAHYPNNHYQSHSHHVPQHHQHHHGPIALAKGALFVGDLSFFTSEADLRRLFAPYGKLKRAEVKRGRFGDSLMHGFVELDVLSGAQRAMQELDGAKFMGRRIRVHWAYSNAEKSSPKDREAWTQLHVTFTSPRIDILMCEEVLDKLFSRFGEVADVTVKKHSRILEPQPFQSGYAFIYFYEAGPAIEAAERFKNTAVADVHFETSLSFRSQRIVENSLATAAAQSLAITGGAGSQLDALLFSDLTISPQVPTSGAGQKHNGSSIAGTSKWLEPSHQLNGSTGETFSVVSESAQTQLAEFDREALLFDQSQQSSDSSLYLYPPFSTPHSDSNLHSSNNNGNSNVVAGQKSVDDLTLLSLQLKNSQLSRVNLQSSEPDSLPVSWAGLTGDAGVSSNM